MKNKKTKPVPITPETNELSIGDKFALGKVKETTVADYLAIVRTTAPTHTIND